MRTVKMVRRDEEKIDLRRLQGLQRLTYGPEGGGRIFAILLFTAGSEGGSGGGEFWSGPLSLSLTVARETSFPSDARTEKANILAFNLA